MTTKYLDAVTLLHTHGHGHLANAAITHYERMASGMDAEHRCKVSAMFDEVLETALANPEPITAADILMSPDFTAIRALARVLQDLGLVEVEIVLGELDVVEAQFVDTLKPPRPPLDIVFDEYELQVSEADEPLVPVQQIPQKTQPYGQLSAFTPGKKPSHRLP